MARLLFSGKAAALLAAVLCASACSPVPRSTIAALHAFDLSTLSARDLRLAVRLPDVFLLEGGAPAMTVTVALNGGAPTTRRYEMVEAPLSGALTAEARAGSTIHVYALDDRSAADLDAYLADVRTTAAPGSRQLALGLSLDGCRTDGRAS